MVILFVLYRAISDSGELCENAVHPDHSVCTDGNNNGVVKDHEAHALDDFNDPGVLAVLGMPKNAVHM